MCRVEIFGFDCEILQHTNKSNHGLFIKGKQMKDGGNNDSSITKMDETTLVETHKSGKKRLSKMERKALNKRWTMIL
jgi:hypothetical protein